MEECEDCAPAIRSASLTCPKCRRKYPKNRMKLVNIYVTPSQKGGKKHKVYYCSNCLTDVDRHTRQIVAQQKEDMERAVREQREYMRGIK